MIEKLKLVNWKSHEASEIIFSPATNLLIGTMGSGKTSCLDAICFAFFGSFPSLKSRQVSLNDVVMSQPTKKTNSLVEVSFTANGRKYVVTRTISSKGSEAFLRCDGALLEGPQPVRTTEAVTRILKVDYDTFARVIYGEQNKIDYLLTLPKGSRKAQMDDLLGLSAFETVRTNANSVVSKLRSEKNSLETFLSGVDLPGLETELNSLRKTLQNSLEQKHSLESNCFALTNEYENIKKNLESLEELKKINEALSLDFVKTQTEADSLYSSAVSVMPSTLVNLSREQCTTLLEQCARNLQEQSDLEREMASLSNSIQRLQGESIVVRQLIEQFPLEALRQETTELSAAAEQLSSASQILMETANREATIKANAASVTAELSEIDSHRQKLMPKLSQLSFLAKEFSSLELLDNEVKLKQRELVELEKRSAAKQESITSLEKTLSLLQGEKAACPTCDQPLQVNAIELLIKQKLALLESEEVVLKDTHYKTSALLTQHTTLSSKLVSWRELLPLAEKVKDLEQRKEKLLAGLNELKQQDGAVSELCVAAKNNVNELKTKVDKLTVLREKLLQAEKSEEKLSQIQRELAILEEQFDKKKLALSTFEPRNAIENKLNETRAALKAFELFEKTELLKKKAATLKEKLSNLQFDESQLAMLRQRSSELFSKLETCKTSLSFVSSDVKDKSELVSKLDLQFSKFSKVKENAAGLEHGLHNLSIFQSSLVETQAQLRSDLISAVNEAMHEVWKNIYPYKDYSSCRVVATEDDYLLELRNGSDWKQVEQCSGGEKTCAALALRVSLAMVLVPNLSWLVLDEPTHNLDSQAVNLLARALHDSLPLIVRQTFVVTHDEALKEGASGSIHVFQRDKDNGAPTIVETLS